MRRRTSRFAAAVAACLVLLSGAASAAQADFSYDPLDYRTPANDPVPSATIAALVGGDVTAARVSSGRYSTDHSRIVFWLEGTNPYPDVINDGSIWAIRADGTERTMLLDFSLGSNSGYYSPAVWVDDDTVTWHLTSYNHDGSGDYWRTVSAAGATDTWTVEPEPGYVTLDGRSAWTSRASGTGARRRPSPQTCRPARSTRSSRHGTSATRPCGIRRAGCPTVRFPRPS